MRPIFSEHPDIKSFVLRSGPMSKSRRDAVERLSPRYQIDVNAGAANWHRLFGDTGELATRPRVLEIGFGMGDSTAIIAAQRRDTDFIAVEVHRPGIAHLLQLIDAQGLSNLRIVAHDAVLVLDQMIPDASLEGVHIFFPDPWPKKRHHKRRLIKPSLVDRLARKLVSGGYVHCATDWQDYAIMMREHFNAHLAFEPSDFVARPEDGLYARPLTKFERRGQKLGYDIFDLIIQKR